VTLILVSLASAAWLAVVCLLMLICRAAARGDGSGDPSAPAQSAMCTTVLWSLGLDEKSAICLRDEHDRSGTSGGSAQDRLTLSL
jgi:hypothetical protein